ncbi:MAG TPA: hypothetical protein VK421_04420, partial [Pyrinomonadaceae bacterium]|nr:hypothetical protein [Pyrinomonadaceae bacterium]
MRVLRSDISRARRTAAAVFALGLCLTVLTPFAPLAQRKPDQGANVTGVSMRPTERGVVITIKGDAPLTRAQTWQDDEGFHIVGYKWEMSSGAPRGVKVRRVGESLEIVIPVRRGGSVSVHPRFNTLDIVVNGGLDAAAGGEEANNSPRRRSTGNSEAATDGHASDARASRRTGSQPADAVRELARSAAPAGVNQPVRTAQGAQQTAATRPNVPARQPVGDVALVAGAQHTQQPSATPAQIEQPQSNSAENPVNQAPAETAATPEQAQPENLSPVQAGVVESKGGSSLLLTATLVVSLFALLFGFFYVHSRRQGDTSD